MRRDLVERARAGDHDAFSLLAGASIGRLDAAAQLILRDADRAQDAVQEALVRCWRDLPGLRDPERFEGWLYRLLLNACYDELRRAGRRRSEVELTPIVIPAMASADPQSASADRDQLERGFRRLAPEQRAVIVLYHYLNVPLPEIAQAMRVPVGTIKSRLHRAKGELRAALEADARTSRDPMEARLA